MAPPWSCDPGDCEATFRKSVEELHSDLSDDVILLQVSQLTGVVNPIIYLYSTKKTTSSVNAQSGHKRRRHTRRLDPEQTVFDCF